MKKCLYCIVFLFMLVFVNTMPVYAEDTDDPILFEKPKTETNEKGHVVNGYIHSKTATSDGNGYNDYLFLGVKGENAVIYFVKKDGYYILHSYDVDSGKWVVANGHYAFNWIDKSNQPHLIQETTVTFKDVSASKGYLCFKISSAYLFDTNIPIFEDGDTKSVDNYVNDGDYSGAENVENIQSTVKDEYDESVPMPHNLKVVQGVDQSGTTLQTKLLTNYNKDVVISWMQEDKLDNMQYDVDVAFSAFRIPDDNFNEIREINTPYYNIANSQSYGSGSNITVKLDASQLNQLKEKGYLGKLYIRVRNKVGKKCSNYARITINIQEKTAIVDETEIDSKGPDTDDEQTSDEYNGTNGNGENGSNLDFSNINVNGVTSFIKDGFGLLGDNGIISLMSRCYLYLPSNVWTLIYFFISMMIVICIISLIKKVVF